MAWIATKTYLLLACTCLLIWSLVYADNDGEERSTYTPKSQRWVLVRRIKHSLTNYAKKYCKAIEDKMEGVRVHREIWKRIKIAQKHSPPELSHRSFCRRGRRRMRMLHGLVALQALLAMQVKANTAERDVCFDTDSKLIGVDNRCSAYISGDISDFDGPVTPTRRTIKGFGGSRTTNVHIGTTRIYWEDDLGRRHEFRLPNSYYVPGCPHRLLSPQHWAKELKKQNPKLREEPKEVTYRNRVELSWGEATKTIFLDPNTNVATFRSASGYKAFDAFCAEAEIDGDSDIHPLCMDTNIISDDEEFAGYEDVGRDERAQDETEYEDIGLSPSGLPSTASGKDKQRSVLVEDELEMKILETEAELLQYHYRFGHAPFNKLRAMAQQGTIPKKFAKCRQPVCAACMYGKATKRQWRHKTPNNKDESFVPTKPGQVVYVDLLRSPTPGFIAQTTGILTIKRYNYACIYVDGYSGLGYVNLQKSSDADETITGKNAFERFCGDRGVRVEHYHADNGIFRAYKWIADCNTKGQSITFAGVNAHHQNGKAEARIRRLQDLTRTMMIHARRRWPTEVSPNLWPYAMRMANDAYNATPNMADKEKRSPEQLFNRTTVTTNPKHWLHFGCPAYKLHESLQGGAGIHHKWKDRSKVGIYLGRSPQHNRQVALVLDIYTGLVSPQFHVKMDPNFDTVPQLYPNRKPSDSLWQLKAGFIAAPTKTPATKSDEQAPSAPKGDSDKIVGDRPNEDPDQLPQRRVRWATESDERNRDQQTETRSSDDDVDSQPPAAPSRKSERKKQPVQRLIEAMTAELTEQEIPGEIFSFQAMFPHDDGYDDNVHGDIMAFKAKADPDTLYLHEALREPDKQKFIEAMEKEIDSQVEMGVYQIIRKDQVPKGATVLPAVWQLRRKRDIRTGEIKKYKARCNIDGSKMIKGEHYEETYAPVASWTSIRLLLSLVLLHDWTSLQLDYVLAYPQAQQDRDLYMKIPKGCTIQGVDCPDDYILKIKRNIYGKKDSGRVWFQHLKKRLERVGFVQSQIDECMFFKGKMVYVLYTDDSILAGPDKDELNETVRQMKEEAELDLTVDGDLSDFLGVNIDRREDGTISLTQTKLIDQVISDMRLDGKSTTTKDTPMASSRILSRHLDSPEHDRSFSYAGVIGKLNYIERGSRPDISYATHQCARFSKDPRQEHAAAVRWLCRYLKKTREQGLVMRPDATKSLEVHVDADFAGNWDPKLGGQDRDTARSRHGYIISYGGIPISYKSQLQTEIALSTTEAEITGLSYALREAIPVIELLKEMRDRGYPVESRTPQIHCKVFEDNAGAVEIARFPKARPRTKHINNRIFHFRSFIDSGDITIHHCPSEDMPADFLTKPLSLDLFEKHRKVVMGW